MVDLFVAFCWIYVGLDYPLWQYLRARYRIVFVWSSTVSGFDPRLGCWDDFYPERVSPYDDDIVYNLKFEPLKGPRLCTRRNIYGC